MENTVRNDIVELSFASPTRHGKPIPPRRIGVLPIRVDHFSGWLGGPWLVTLIALRC